MSHENITDITTYLRAHATELGERILETYPPLQSTKDPLAPRIATLLRKALPAQALAITGTAKYLRKAKAARIVAECGAGKTYMALGAIHVLADGRPSTTLVMCPSHITHKWARETLLTVPRARAFLIEDMRNGGDPKKAHGVCEVWLRKGRIVYEGMRLSLADLRRMSRKEWRKRCPAPAFFITGKDKGKLGYYWEHVFLKAKSGPNLGGVVNPDTGLAILDSERQKLTYLDFDDKVKLSELLTRPQGGTIRYSALWQADRERIQRMAPIEFVGRYMPRWFDFAIADELHQLAGDTAQGNGLGVLGRAARRLIALTGTLMGGYSPTRENTFLRNRQQPVRKQGNAEGRRELAFCIFGGRSCRRDPFFPQSSRRRSSQPMQTRRNSATTFCDSSNPSGRRCFSPKTSITACHAASGILLIAIARLFMNPGLPLTATSCASLSTHCVGRAGAIRSSPFATLSAPSSKRFASATTLLAMNSALPRLCVPARWRRSSGLKQSIER